MGRWSYGAAAETMVVGICMVFVCVVSCELCFFVWRATFAFPRQSIH
jgi:hypothetical protein